MILQAAKSIERSKPTQRELQALTLSIDPEKVVLAKKKIREFLSEMRELVQGPTNTQVYQLNVQFFNLTQERFPE